jgi:hypothetical protein
MKSIHHTLNHALILIFCSLMFINCSGGNKQQQGEVKLNLGAIAGISNTDGGVILEGIGPNGQFVKNIASGAISYQLARGQWTFRVVAWSSTNPMEGVMRCDRQVLNLNTDSATVNFSLSTSKCDDVAFGGAKLRNPGTGGFSPIKLQSCSNLQEDIALYGASNMMGGIDCTQNPGKEKSFEIVIPTLDTPGTAPFPTPVLKSQCFNVAGPYATTTVILPDMGIPINIRAYSGLGCSGDLRLFSFLQGLGQLPVANDAIAQYTIGQTEISLDSNWCSGEALTALPFASGAWVDNASGDMNYICTEQQLRSLCYGQPNFNDNHDGMDSSIALAADINLSGSIWNSADCSAGDDSGNFFGSFYGNRHTISNGINPFFQLVDTAIIQSLHLDNFNISGILTGGILAVALNNAPSTIEDIKITNSTITPDSSADGIGGLIGAIITDTGPPKQEMSNITIDNVDILGDLTSAQSNVGGLIGKFIVSTTEQSLEITQVKITNSTIEANAFVGGLIGQIYSTTGTPNNFLREIKLVDNQVIGGGDKVGGVIGEHNLNNGQTQLELVHVSGAAASVAVEISVLDATGIGGLVGASIDAGKIIIRDSLFDGAINLTAAGAYSFFRVGGFGGDITKGAIHNSTTINEITITAQDITEQIGGMIGQAGMAGASGVQIDQSAVHSTITLGGTAQVYSSVGGAIGKSDSGTIPADFTKIENSLVEGSIVIPNNTTWEQTVAAGGIIGLANSSRIFRVVSHFDVKGGKNIGGAIGDLTNGSQASQIMQFFVAGDVHAKGTLSSTEGNGGLIGNISDVTNIPNINHGFYTGSFINDIDCSTDNNCGSLIGLLIGAPNCDIMTTDTGYTAAGAQDTTISPGINSGSAGCQNSSTFGDSVKAAFSTAPPLDANRDLEFVAQWKLLDPSLQVAGTRHDPLVINSVAKWIAIATSNYLLKKSFKLGADIDFGSSSFVPWGGPGAISFDGELKGEGYKLKNVDIQSAECNSDACGMVMKMGANLPVDNWAKPSFGTYQSPVIIEGLNLVFPSDSSVAKVGGVVGHLERGGVAAQLTSGSISNTNTASTPAVVGGLVGTLTNGYIQSSKFEGQINLTDEANFQYVGGIAGELHPTIGGGGGGGGGQGSIKSSYSVISFLGTAGHKGGIVGRLGGQNTTSSKITEVFSIINSLGTIVGSQSGGIIGYMNPMGNSDVEVEYAIAINPNADGMRGIMGRYQSGSTAGFDNSTMFFIGDDVNHSMEPDNSGTPFGTATDTWATFQSDHANMFSPYMDIMVSDSNYSRPRMFWEYPAGYFPVTYVEEIY